MSISDGKTEYEFELPGVTPMGNKILRMHWAKRSKLVQDYAWMTLKAVGVNKHRVPLEKCIISIERRAKKNPITPQRWDWDNLISGTKFFIDALTARHKYGIGLIKDDNIDCIVSMPVIIPTYCEDGEPERTFVKIWRVE